MKLPYFLKTYLTENLKSFISKNKCCGTISFKYDCCNNKKKWTASAIDDLDVITDLTYQLKHKEIIVLDYFKNQFQNDCCLEGKILKLVCCNGKNKFSLEDEPVNFKLQTFLNEDSLGFPVGVFVDGEFKDFASSNEEVVIIMNSNGITNVVADPFVIDQYVTTGGVLPTNVKVMRYWQVDSTLKTGIICGENDKILPKLVGGTVINATTLTDRYHRLHSYSDIDPGLGTVGVGVWQDYGAGANNIYRKVYESLNPSTIETVTIFHNDDTSPCGISSLSSTTDEGDNITQTGNCSNLYGNFPKNTTSIVHWGAENIVTANLGFDNILNWAELNPNRLTVLNDTAFGGGVNDFDLTKLPLFTHFTNLQALSLWGVEKIAWYDLTQTNFPNLKSFVLGFVAEDLEAYDWSTFPNVTQQLHLAFSSASTDLGLRNFCATFTPTHTYSVSDYLTTDYPMSRPHIRIDGVHDATSTTNRNLLRARGWAMY